MLIKRSECKLSWLVAAMTLATTFILCWAMGYRPFPSVDDFIYIPLARAQMDPGLFASDYFIQNTVLHVPLWPYLISALEVSVGLAGGLWGLTVLLAAAAVAAIMVIMRTLGSTGLLLPLAAYVAFNSQVQGLGRGDFDGAFGAAFHMQWLALVSLLWSYAAFLNGRAMTSGIVLGFAALAHPVVAVHGAFVIFVATLFSGPGRWRRLVFAALGCLTAGSPAILPLALEVIGQPAIPVADMAGIAGDGYLFRLPHEYILRPIMVIIFGILVVLGLACTATLKESKACLSVGPFFGLQLGHIILFLAAVGFHLQGLHDLWPDRTLLPFQLVLTRTTPILLVLSSIAIFSAWDHAFLVDKDANTSTRIGWILFWGIVIVVLTFYLIGNLREDPFFQCLALLTLVTAAVRNRPIFVLLAAASWILIAGYSFCRYASEVELELALEPHEAGLYNWIQQETSPGSLFIIPPDQQAFRFYTSRSAYVDFKLFPSSTPALILDWRRRMEEVAKPDRLAIDGDGWPGLSFWSRTYALRNSHAAIAALLEDSGADYFVRDGAAEAIPPFVPSDASASGNDAVSPPLELLFSNDRFQVYRLGSLNSG